MASLRIDEWLPEGWKVEVRVRKTGKRDRYYIDPKTGYVFRSLKAIDRYLLSGEIQRRARVSRGRDNKSKNAAAATAGSSSSSNSKKQKVAAANVPPEGTSSKKKKLSHPSGGEPIKTGTTTTTPANKRVTRSRVLAGDLKKMWEKAAAKKKKKKTSTSDEPPVAAKTEQVEHSEKTEEHLEKEPTQLLLVPVIESKMVTLGLSSTTEPKKSTAPEPKHEVAPARKQQAKGRRKFNGKPRNPNSNRMKKTAESSSSKTKKELNSFFIQESDDNLIETSSDIEEIIESLNRGDGWEEDNTVYISASELAALLVKKMQQPEADGPPNLVAADPPDHHDFITLSEGCYRPEILRSPPPPSYGGASNSTIKCEQSSQSIQGVDNCIFTAPTTDVKSSDQFCDAMETHLFGSSLEFTFPFGYLCSDPCFEFAIKTLSGVINPTLPDGIFSDPKVEEYAVNNLTQISQKPVEVQESNDQSR